MELDLSKPWRMLQGLRVYDHLISVLQSIHYNQIGWLKGEHTDSWPLHGNFFPRMLRGSVYRVYRYIAGRMVGEFLEALIRQDSGVQNVDPRKIFPFGSTGKSDPRIFCWDYNWHLVFLRCIFFAGLEHWPMEPTNSESGS